MELVCKAPQVSAPDNTPDGCAFDVFETTRKDYWGNKYRVLNVVLYRRRKYWFPKTLASYSERVSTTDNAVMAYTILRTMQGLIARYNATIPTRFCGTYQKEAK